MNRKCSKRKKLKPNPKIDNSDPSQFCPKCQVPFNTLKIHSFVHISRCEVNWQLLEECKAREKCDSTDIFHYRDYSHSILAEFRSSLMNKTINNLHPINKNKSDYSDSTYNNINSNSDRSKNNVEEEKELNDSESDDDIFLKLKKKQFSNYRIIGDPETDQNLLIDQISCYSNTTEINIKNEFHVIKNESYTTVNDTNETDLAGDASDFLQCNNNETLDDVIQRKEKCRTEWKLLLNGNQGSVDKKAVSNGSGLLTGNNKTIKICPSYKKIPGTRFAVDAFQFGAIQGISTYFLTHFHYDHYIGLKKSFQFPIYCTDITARLVVKKIKINDNNIHILEYRKSTKIENVEVIALDANHCPGSVILLFRLPNGDQYLHTGDFRANSDMEYDPLLNHLSISKLFLDTTYCDPEYIFPSQKEVIDRVRSIVKEKHFLYPRALFICGSYTIGKEKVFTGMLEELNCKLWAEKSKRTVFQCVNNDVILSACVDDPKDAKVHVLPMCRLKFEIMRDYLADFNNYFSHIFAFKPSGWELGKCNDDDWINSESHGNITIYGVPYSEHSSYEEICKFVKFIKPLKIVPTVNLGNRRMHALLKELVSSYSVGAKQSSIDNFILTIYNNK